MKLRSMDLIITIDGDPEPSQMIAQGYAFICSDIDVQTFLDRDCEVDTPSHHIIACPNENGVNFYAKARPARHSLL